MKSRTKILIKYPTTHDIVARRLLHHPKEEMPMKSDFFITKDLGLSGALHSKGVKLVRVDRQGKLCFFVFENRSFCESLQQPFYAKTLDVDALEYTNSLRVLKDLVFSRS